jgi:type IV secretory pathway VirB10-like protein
MSLATHSGLPATSRIVIISAALLALVSFAECAVAQNKEEKRDDLDVTMQIIVDPHAKLPDEVVRRIPLPARKTAPESTPNAGKEPAKPDAASKGQERASEAKEMGREVSEQAKERAQEAADQREQASRSKADKRRRTPTPPVTPPGRPTSPPGR